MGLKKQRKVVSRTLKKLRDDQRALKKKKTIGEKIRSSPRVKRAKRQSKKVSRNLRNSLEGEIQALRDFRPRL